MIFYKKNEKNNRNNKSDPDPYEDIVKFEKLDPHEALIRSTVFLQQNSKSIQEYD
tara:strand:+ start:566 stop:730 length:165 start_codon:yes stop_codon:yes gene_type:complete